MGMHMYNHARTCRRMMRTVARTHAATLTCGERLCAEGEGGVAQDTDADRAYGTRTLPRVLGNERARTLALALHTACGTALLALPATRTDAATAWGWSTIAVGVLLRVLPTDHLRDPVDAALGVQAVVVTVVLAAG